MAKKKAPSLRYEWKLVRELQKGDVVVIAQEEVMVVNIKHEGSEWVIGYDGATVNSASEQMYQDHDSVYAKRETDQQG